MVNGIDLRGVPDYGHGILPYGVLGYVPSEARPLLWVCLAVFCAIYEAQLYATAHTLPLSVVLRMWAWRFTHWGKS